jgi:Zn-dependent protease with chaperone function
MSFPTTLVLVLLASYGLCNLLLSVAVGALWRAGGFLPLKRADALLALRLLPAAGSALAVLTVVLPAFLLYEPAHADDKPGALLVVAAGLALLVIFDGIRRAARAARAARALVRSAPPLRTEAFEDGARVSLVNLSEPVVAVVGGWRQRIVAAHCVAAACDGEEFRQVVAHETAHIDARDNLKLLALLAVPDVLAWLPAGRALNAQWQAAAEIEADERASGADPHKRVALASALIKVARLAIAGPRSARGAHANEPGDGLEQRIKRLLAPPAGGAPAFPGRRIATSALLVPLLAVPLYAFVHRVIEFLVAFGR